MTGELAVPPPSTPEDIDKLPIEERGVLITRALEESKGWLAVAVRGTDPTPIAEFKAWAATVAEMTRQKGLAEEIRLDAQEMVIRATRALGISVRNGQDAGEILTRSEHRAAVPPGNSKASPKDFLVNGKQTSETYRMVDGVTEDQFEEAVAEGRQEGNLARANVVRKIRGIKSRWLTRAQKAEKIRELAQQGCSSRQMVAQLNTADETIRDIAREYGVEIPADKVTQRTHHIDPERVVRETVHTLDGAAYGIGLLTAEDYDQLDPELISDSLDALTEPVSAIRHMMKELQRRDHQD